MNELPPWLSVLYPFKGNSFHSDEGILNYVDEGSGPVVVMLHGNPTWSFFYRDLIISMRDSCRCLALDHLGCGLSDKPMQGEYTLAGHIRRAVAWLESLTLDRPIHLVVHDWGGAIGFGVADALKEQVARITVFNTAAFTFPTVPIRIGLCRLPGIGTLMVRGANAFVEGATRMTTVRPMPQAVKDGYRYPYPTWNERVAIDAFVKDIPMHSRHPSWKTLLAVEQSLSQWWNCPVQIIWGMRDWCFHEPILRQWTEHLPDAEVHRLHNAGHYLLEDAGEEIIPLVRQFVLKA